MILRESGSRSVTSPIWTRIVLPAAQWPLASMIPAARAMSCHAEKSPWRSPTAMIRWGGAALNAGAAMSEANNAAMTSASRRTKATAPPIDCASVALAGQIGNAVNLPFRCHRPTCTCCRPDLLEVPSGMHDISMVANGPFARARGEEMAIWQDPRTTTDRPGGVNAATVGVPRAARDVGLRSYMLSVYNYMASGVLLTGIIAMLFAPYAGQVLISANGRGMSG